MSDSRQLTAQIFWILDRGEKHSVGVRIVTLHCCVAGSDVGHFEVFVHPPVTRIVFEVNSDEGQVVDVVGFGSFHGEVFGGRGAVDRKGCVMVDIITRNDGWGVISLVVSEKKFKNPLKRDFSPS